MSGNGRTPEFLCIGIAIASLSLGLGEEMLRRIACGTLLCALAALTGACGDTTTGADADADTDHRDVRRARSTRRARSSTPFVTLTGGADHGHADGGRPGRHQDHRLQPRDLQPNAEHLHRRVRQPRRAARRSIQRQRLHDRVLLRPRSTTTAASRRPPTAGGVLQLHRDRRPPAVSTIARRSPRCGLKSS